MVKDAERCMKCGFCMSVCPVYSADHIEAHVARGRNVLISMDLPERSYKDVLSFCLLCKRCEAVCPAKVPSADITIRARERLVKERGLGIVQFIIYRILLFRRDLLARILYLLSKIPRFSLKDAPFLRHMADSYFIFFKEVLIPKLSVPFLSKRIKKVEGSGEKIAVFPGCSFEFFFSYIGEKIFLFLSKNGYLPEYPSETGCCGFPIYVAGDIDTAKKLAKKNIDALLGYEKIVTGCATCASALKGYRDWFEEKEWKEKAEEISKKVMVLSEFIVKEGIEPESRLKDVTVSYHDPCHLKWHQGIYIEPRQVIKRMKEVKFLEIPDICCGLGGAFGIIHRDVSLKIQKKRMESIKEVSPQIIATECPGCLLQLQDGVRRFGIKARVVHLVELLMNGR